MCYENLSHRLSTTRLRLMEIDLIHYGRLHLVMLQLHLISQMM